MANHSNRFVTATGPADVQWFNTIIELSMTVRYCIAEVGADSAYTVARILARFALHRERTTTAY